MANKYLVGQIKTGDLIVMERQMVGAVEVYKEFLRAPDAETAHRVSSALNVQEGNG